MTSVLEQEYVPATRPYSLNELNFSRSRFHTKIGLGTSRAHHRRCDHFYLTRTNGEKAKKIAQSNNPDSGSCSVCWKLRKTPHELRQNAVRMIECFSNQFYREPAKMTYDLLDLETTFYRWLYLEKGYDVTQ